MNLILVRRRVRWAAAISAAIVGFVAAPAAAQTNPPNALRLDDVLAAALAQHPLLEAAQARVTAARGARRTAGVLPNPVLTYWTESAPFPGQTFAKPLDRETQAYATLPLEFLFQRWPQVRAANATVGAASADLARARQTVALDAARAFYRVAAAQVAADAADDVRARIQDLVTYNDARVREGKTAEADLIRTQVELDRVDANAAVARAELARARAGLAPYLGPVAGADTAVAGRSPASVRVAFDEARGGSAAPVVPSLDASLASARVSRPDVIAARARVTAAQAQTGYQRSLTIRNLGATFGTKRTLGVNSMIAGLSLPFPLFDQNRGEVQRATALATAAQAELAWTERQAAAEVEAAHEVARSLSAQAGRLGATMLTRAEESRRIAVAAYQEGAMSLLQVLDATRTLADARQAYYRLLFAQRESVLELRAAVGDSTLTGDRP